MKLTILGSGTMVLTKKRNASGYLLEAAGKTLLLEEAEKAIGNFSKIMMAEDGMKINI